MTYRDELEAAHARNEALERELATARREIAELKGDKLALVPAGSTALAKMDATKRKVLLFNETFEGQLSEAALAEIGEFLADLANSGLAARLVVMSGSVSWQGAVGSYLVKVRVSSRRGEVKVSVQKHVAAQGFGAGVLGALIGGGIGFGTAGVAAGLALSPAIGLLPILPVAWWLKRRLHRRFRRKQIESTSEFFNELVELTRSLVQPVAEDTSADSNRDNDNDSD